MAAVPSPAHPSASPTPPYTRRCHTALFWRQDHFPMALLPVGANPHPLPPQQGPSHRRAIGRDHTQTAGVFQPGAALGVNRSVMNRQETHPGWRWSAGPGDAVAERQGEEMWVCLCNGRGTGLFIKTYSPCWMLPTSSMQQHCPPAYFLMSAWKALPLCSWTYSTHWCSLFSLYNTWTSTTCNLPKDWVSVSSKAQFRQSAP